MLGSRREDEVVAKGEVGRALLGARVASDIEDGKDDYQIFRKGREMAIHQGVLVQESVCRSKC